VLLLCIHADDVCVHASEPIFPPEKAHVFALKAPLSGRPGLAEQAETKIKRQRRATTSIYRARGNWVEFDPGMDDRRTQSRLPVPRVLVKISTPERMRVAYLKDLTEGGVFIRTDKPLQLERVVDVDLLAPGRTEPLRLRGRIVRVQNDEASRVANLTGMGVKFIEVTPQQDGALKALVNEYSTKPASLAPASEVPDASTVQLRQALETVEVLRVQLNERENELRAEHDRRQDLSVRVLALTKELEGVKARGADGSGVALEALKVELTAARAELGELKARLAQAEGNAASYRQEIAVLEEDDAQTRRLAEALAQQKAKQDAELKKLREDIQHHAQLAEQERGTNHVRSTETARQLESERARTRELESRVEDLASTNASLTARAAEVEGMLDQAKKHVSGLGQTVGDLTAARARIATLELAVSEEKQKNERLRSRERELRALVAAISAKGDDVVVMDDGTQSSDAPPPSVAPVPSVPPVQASFASAAPPSQPITTADPWQPGQTLVMMTMPQGEPIEEEPTSPAIAPLIPSVAPVVPTPAPAPPPIPAPAPAAAPPVAQLFEQSALTSPPPFEFAENAPPPPPPAAIAEPMPITEAPAPVSMEIPISEELPVDVDMNADVDSDWGGQAESIAVPPSPEEQAFLQRLRNNDKLVRHPKFFDYTARDPEEEKVIGSLMGADRFEDLKVLSRGACTPEHLESFLIRFHQLGLIGFN
jgi:hypothetical protein